MIFYILRIYVLGQEVSRNMYCGERSGMQKDLALH